MINRKSNFIESRINKNEHTCKILLERVNRLTHVQRTIKRQENIEEKGLNTSKENMQAPTHAKNMSNVTDDILRRNTLTMDKSKFFFKIPNNITLDANALIPEKHTQSMNKPSVGYLLMSTQYRFYIT